MTDRNEKLFIKIGESFEANASGRLAIVVVLILACVVVYAMMT